MRPISTEARVAPPPASRRNWPDALVVAALVVFVGLIYGARLGLPPLVGEETRWGSSAREMLATGDWIVPRQQGQVFPERPPMTIWTMAAVGLLRGDVDPVAIRLPSVLGVVLTCLVIYAYARTLLSQSSALAAAIVYATFGQVLQMGRLGESESVFAFFVSASLLLWHLGYLRRWPAVATWSCGFAFAALGALVKGPQAPVYFAAITLAYLAYRRDWRFILGWQPLAGLAMFAAIIAVWQVPFYRATDWPAVVATWAGLAGDRIHLRGLLEHAFNYPAQTFVCLLPWSPMLIALFRPGIRALLADKRPVVEFLVIAIVVAYPTVWMAAGARGRYFMPLYPVVAVLIGLLIDRCSHAARGSAQRRGWNLFTLAWAVLIGTGSLAIAGAGLLGKEMPQRLYQPTWFATLFGAGGTLAALVLWLAFRRPDKIGSLVAVLAIAATAAVGAGGVMMNVNVARWQNPTSIIADLKRQLPPDARLVSLSPIDHRFAYYYGDEIAELPWPLAVSDLPPNVDYFCFMRNPGDTPAARRSGRGRTWQNTPGTVPFAWEELDSICTDRQPDANAPMMVVLGRVIRPLRAEVTDVTRSRRSTAQQPGTKQRK